MLAERVLTLANEIGPEERRDGSLVRSVTVREAFTCRDGCVHGSDRCRPGSGGYHGQGSRRLEFSVAVLGRGGVSVEVGTPQCAAPDLTERYLRRWSPIGALHIHYADPPEYLRELDWSSETCSVIEGPCWSDVTFLQSDTAVDVLLAGGVEGVWSWLAEGWLPGALGGQT